MTVGKVSRQRLSRVGPLIPRNLLRSTLGNDTPALLATFRPQIDDPVRIADHIQINLDVIRNADWIVDLGPEGGEEGGRSLPGTQEQVARNEISYTGQALAGYFPNGQVLREKTSIA